MYLLLYGGKRLSVTIYSTGCPRCKVLEAKLKEKNIEFNEITNVKDIRAAGFLSVPVLVIDNNPPMDFIKAIKWVNSLED